jgi:hypothetical protein
VTEQPAAEIDAIVGADRKRRLIEAAADRWTLYGEFSSNAQALRYAQQTWPDAAILVARGQVWRRKGPARRGDIGVILGRDDETVTIEQVLHAEQMVDVGGGRRLNYMCYLTDRYELIGWHPDFVPGGDNPQPPAASLAPPEEQPTGGEPPFDPRAMFVLVQREADLDAYIKARTAGGEAGHGPHWMPMTRPYWRSGTTECPVCYFTAIDVVAFINDPVNLANYRAGWPDFLAAFEHKDAHWNYFNELSWGGFDTDLQVAAYLGQWLFQAIRGDVAREHGGTGADYDTGFMWAGDMADVVLEACPFADPRVDLPADHALAQCDGQESLL